LVLNLLSKAIKSCHKDLGKRQHDKICKIKKIKECNCCIAKKHGSFLVKKESQKIFPIEQ
jgi:hypothetical protein